MASANDEGSRDLRLRVRAIWGVFLVGIALILAKTIYVQVVQGGQYRLVSNANHIELKREISSRGIIYDRNGVPLVTNAVVEGELKRLYPLGKATAPILGYISEVTSEEVGCFEGICYLPGMEIGRAGLERALESQLKGRDGGRLIEIDARGQEVRELGNNLPEPGSDIYLSIDSRLQSAMYSALGDAKGAAVAIDMQGKILGMVSTPTYDPSNLSPYLTDQENNYFLNRAGSGVYPPGSIFKMVTAIAGLAEGKIDRATSYEDTGELTIGSYRYGNWYFDQYGRTEGQVDLIKALSRSNDIYFYKIGEEIGVDNIVKWARKFGLGEKTGLELSNEQAGLVPDRLYKERLTGEKWFLGNTYHLSIGQGDLLITPAQGARMTLASVTGRKCELSFLRDKSPQCVDLGLRSEDLSLIAEGMSAACSAGGTAYTFFEFEPRVLCKTGTAQHGGQVNEEVLPHAWITVVYPAENPEIILTVILEAAGEGSSVAGPVATEILSKWRDLGKEPHGTTY